MKSIDTISLLQRQNDLQQTNILKLTNHCGVIANSVQYNAQSYVPDPEQRISDIIHELSGREAEIESLKYELQQKKQQNEEQKLQIQNLTKVNNQMQLINSQNEELIKFSDAKRVSLELNTLRMQNAALTADNAEKNHMLDENTKQLSNIESQLFQFKLMERHTARFAEIVSENQNLKEKIAEVEKTSQVQNINNDRETMGNGNRQTQIIKSLCHLLNVGEDDLCREVKMLTDDILQIKQERDAAIQKIVSQNMINENQDMNMHIPVDSQPEEAKPTEFVDNKGINNSQSSLDYV